MGVLPLLCRDRVILVRELVGTPSMDRDSGAGSTTMTVRTQEWLTDPLDPVIVTLYFPSAVDRVVDTRRLVLVVNPGASFSGF